MPNGIRVYTSLRGAGLVDAQALAISSVVASAQAPLSRFRRDEVIDVFCDAGFTEHAAETLADTLAHCFPSERFLRRFEPTALKTAMVRAALAPAICDSLLSSIALCILTPTRAEVRAPVRRPPNPGQVVMCDFRHLTPPEMQKERRAIVVSNQAASGVGRCTLVPVSMARVSG